MRKMTKFSAIIGLALFSIIFTGAMTMWPFKPAIANEAQPIEAQKKKNAYDFTFDSLVGDDPLPLANYRGQVILVVNTASQCGFTGQYEGLEKLYEKYKNQGFVIIGVPSNDFGNQEPGSNQDIAHFCKLNYGVSFPMAAKEHVKGPQAHPFYKWAEDRYGFLGSPKWNFHKYLIDRQGNLDDYFHSTTAPDSSTLTKAIERLLAPNQPDDNDDDED